MWGKVEGGAKTVRRTASINSVPNSSIKVGDKMFTCNQVSIFCLTVLILTLVLSVLMVSGYIVIIRFYHMNAGLREPKICIWLSMNKLLWEAPSNANLSLSPNLHHVQQKCATF